MVAEAVAATGEDVDEVINTLAITIMPMMADRMIMVCVITMVLIVATTEVVEDFKVVIEVIRITT